MMTNFFRTIAAIRDNDFINPNIATLKHVAWVFRKVLNIFPCDLQIGSFHVRIADRSIANGVGAQLNATGYFDPNNMYLIEELSKRKIINTFFDIGSNIGVYSLIAASFSHDMRVLAFEPHPATFSFLEENIRLNHKEDSVSCFKTALGDEDGTILFQDSPGNAENQVLKEKSDEMASVIVDICKGESVCLKYDIQPQVLKIDVEGFENKVIVGFGNYLQDTWLIFVECWNLSETVDLLCRKAGFMGPYKVDYKRRRFVTEDIHEEDWVFINPHAMRRLTELLNFEISGD